MRITSNGLTYDSIESFTKSPNYLNGVTGAVISDLSSQVCEFNGLSLDHATIEAGTNSKLSFVNVNFGDVTIKDGISGSIKIKGGSRLSLDNASIKFANMSDGLISIERHKGNIVITGNVNCGLTIDDCNEDFSISIKGSKIVNGTIRNSYLYNSSFDGESLFVNFTMENTDFVRSSVTYCFLRNACFRNVNLSSTVIQHSDLSWADMSSITVNNRTLISDTAVIGMKINSLAIKSLRNDHDLRGNTLTGMIITDDWSMFRANFEGFWRYIHLSSLIALVSPIIIYSLYIVSRSWFSSEPERTSNLLISIALYLFPFFHEMTFINLLVTIASVVALVYNSLRFSLWYKKETILLDEEITGIATKFSFSDSWGPKFLTYGRLIDLYQFLFWTNLILVFFTSFYHLLNVKVMP